jgi:Tol biopolymer transport system component
MARKIKTSLMAAAAVLLGGAPLAAQMPGQPGFPANKIIGFDVHEGTSMSVAVSPDGRMLAVDLQGSLWIVPARGGTAKRITDYFNDARQPVWSPDGKSLVYFAYRDGNYDLWMISADGTGQKKLTDGMSDDREPAFSPDGKYIAFSSDRAGKGGPTYNIWTMEVATGVLRQITSNAFEDRLPTWSPDGREIAYSSPRDKLNAIWATSLADSTERMIKQSAGRIDAPSWGPKGQLSAVTSDDNGSRLELDGTVISGSENVFPFRASWVKGANDFYYVSDGKIRKRSGTRTSTVEFTAHLEVTRPDYVRAKHDYDSTAPRKALGIERPMISPDGSRIAFVALGDLYVTSVKGGTPENLTNDHAMDSDPAWSPDGNSIVYTSDKGGGLPQLWIRDMKTKRDRRLTNIDTQPLGAAWSPDGERIAYIDVDGRWGVAGVCVVDVRTGKIVRLQASLPQPGAPTWSPDGKYVAITLSKLFSKSFREGTNQVYVIPTDGKTAPFWQMPDVNVGIDTRGGGGPAWSPDGKRMAAIYEGLLKIWSVSPEGAPLGPVSSYTSEIAFYPTWTADSKTILYQSNDKLKTIDVETGTIREVPLNLTYTLAKPTGRTVIHVGKLVDSVRDATQVNKDIVIEGNRIVAVRDHNATLYAPADRIIEAADLTAIPGLIEHHAHSQKDFGAASHRAWLAYGITTVRDPGNQVYYGLEDREAQEAGVRIGPRFYTTGPLLEWQRVFYKMGVAVSGPAHLERELERARILHHDIIKSYVRMPDLQQRRIVEAAHAMGVPVTGHEIFPAAFSGVDATEHMGATSRRGYSPKQGPQGRAYEDVVQLFGQSRRTVTPTLFGSLTSYLEKNPAFKNDPRVKLYPLWAQQSVATSGADFSAAAAGLPGALKAVKDMWDAGALVTAGTDTTIAINLLSEIAAYVDAGLTPFQALQSVTSNPAKSLNLDAGTLEAGKLADIVLIEGDPRQNIANTFNVRKVIMNGVAYDEDELLNPKTK